jgi:hypothetical protein
MRQPTRQFLQNTLRFHMHTYNDRKKRRPRIDNEDQPFQLYTKQSSERYFFCGVLLVGESSRVECPSRSSKLLLTGTFGFPIVSSRWGFLNRARRETPTAELRKILNEPAMPPVGMEQKVTNNMLKNEQFEADSFQARLRCAGRNEYHPGVLVGRVQEWAEEQKRTEET